MSSSTKFQRLTTSKTCRSSPWKLKKPTNLQERAHAKASLRFLSRGYLQISYYRKLPREDQKKIHTKFMKTSPLCSLLSWTPLLRDWKFLLLIRITPSLNHLESRLKTRRMHHPEFLVRTSKTCSHRDMGRTKKAISTKRDWRCLRRRCLIKSN